MKKTKPNIHTPGYVRLDKIHEETGISRPTLLNIIKRLGIVTYTFTGAGREYFIQECDMHLLRSTCKPIKVTRNNPQTQCG